jgi:hypothetical protein
MAFNQKYAQLQSTTLAGAGAAIGDTSIVLTSFKSIDGVNLAMTDFGDIGYATIEPNSRESEEQVSFTGITQNVNGTATLTGIKTVGMLTPHTETSGLAKSHAGGVKFVVSNTSAFHQSIIDYVDGIAIAGAPDAATGTKGIAKMSFAPAVSTEPIAVGDNDPRVPTAAQVGYIPTADQKAALAGTGTPSAANKFATADTLAALPATITAPAIRSYTSNATWTKPAGLKYVIVEVQAGGGGGGAAWDSETASGGGGGGYSKKIIGASSLGATETVTVGAGGAGGVDSGHGSAGGTSSFGVHCSATGGGGGNGGGNFGGADGGVGSNGDLNIKGGGGGGGMGTSGISGIGGSSFLGGGGKVVHTNNNGQIGGAYGGGGSGAADVSGGSRYDGGAGAAGIVIVTEYYI